MGSELGFEGKGMKISRLLSRGMRTIARKLGYLMKFEHLTTEG